MQTDFQTILNGIKPLFEAAKSRDELLAGICAKLKEEVYHYDWVGFYLLDESNHQLVLGPYVGKPTEHTHIPVGNGVCGQVAESGKTKVVQDVSEENNYIACSIDVQSEIVVPVMKNGKFVAEIDIDSHSAGPFTQEDEQFLGSICNWVAEHF
jgi:L-methionine (R)-S-oxide reductase